MTGPFKVPLNALRAIEIVARGGTLSAAATELGVTAGAISQHVKRAEERLGYVLFERTPQGLVPTPVLKRALPLLQDGFQALADAVATLDSEHRGTLVISTAPAFAARWLVQRLGRFTGEHPEIEVRFVATPHVIDLAHSEVDCAIRLGRGSWPGVEADRLLEQSVFPVCAPVWRDRLQRPADLAHVPVIADDAPMINWPTWFAAIGEPEPPMSGPCYTDPLLALEAVLAGQGAMLAWGMLVSDALADGRLVRPFAAEARTELSYWFVATPAKRKSRKVRLFRDWLLRETGR